MAKAKDSLIDQEALVDSLLAFDSDHDSLCDASDDPPCRHLVGLEVGKVSSACCHLPADAVLDDVLTPCLR